MRVLIVGIIVLALAVAAVSTYLIKTFSTPAAIEEIEAAVEPVRPRVLVATRKLNRGDVLRGEHLRWQLWPEEGVNPLYVTVEKDDQEAAPIQEYTGAIVRDDVEEGEPILPSKVFKRGESGVMAGILKPGMRAVAIPVQPDTSAGGFILPGDRVDVLLSHNKAQEALRRRQESGGEGEAGGAGEPFVVLSMTTETILRNVLVLAVGGAVGPPEGATMQAPNATLELTPKQAELMATAQTMGKLSLTLRSIGSAEIEGDPRSFTTDVEVSPFLSNLEAVMEGEREQALAKRIEKLEEEKRIQEQIAREQAGEIEVLSTTIEQSGQKVPETRVQTPPKESVVKIYRGGAQQVEEVSQDGSNKSGEAAEQ